MRKIIFSIILFCAVLFPFRTFSKADSETASEENNIPGVERISNQDIEVIIPNILFTFRNVEIKLKFKNPQHSKLLSSKNKINFIINGQEKELLFVNGETSFTYRFDKTQTLSIYTEDFSYIKTVRACPLWAVLLPLFLLAWLTARFTKKKHAMS